jgi:HAD superfamily hydrolase (TIGR01490 family)
MSPLPIVVPNVSMLAELEAKVSSNDRPYYAFFDVDHTLMRGSTGAAFGKELWRANVINVLDLARLLVWHVMYISGRMDEVEIWKRGVQRLFGEAEATIRQACEDAHSRLVLPRLYREGEEEIAHHRKHGAQIALISAGPRHSIMQVAKEFGIDRVSTGWANVVDGRVHDLAGVEIPYGPMKRVHAQRHCDELGADPKDCWAYGDSPSDIEMLEFVGHPVAVNPRGELRRVAEARGWTIVRWTRTRGPSIVPAP